MLLRPLLLSLALATATHATEPAPSPTPAPAGVYETDPAHTSVLWSLDHSGLSHWTARFTSVAAVLDWKPEDPTASTLRVSINPASVRTDFPHSDETDLDGMIANDFLAGAPITFVSTRVEKTGANTGLVYGDLTFRSQTHPVSLAVTFNGSLADHPFSHEAKVGFSATTSFQRSDWGLDVLIPFIGDTVTLTIETQMTAQES